MHKARTPWPIQTRAAYIASFEEARRRYPQLSARTFCQAADMPYATFSRWWAAWRCHDKKALMDRSHRPRRSPTALPGHVLDIIRKAHLLQPLQCLQSSPSRRRPCPLSSPAQTTLAALL